MAAGSRVVRSREIRMRCKACGHEFAAPMFLPMPLARAIEVMRGIVANGCPSCGATGDELTGAKRDG